MKKVLCCGLLLPLCFLWLSPPIAATAESGKLKLGLPTGESGKRESRSGSIAMAGTGANTASRAGAGGWNARLSPSGAGAAVLTQHNDPGRTGANLDETILNTATVNPAIFGKLFTRAVDGYIYAQPLYMPSVTVAGGGQHNVVFVATEHDSVYAFDADDPNQSAPLWQASLGIPVPSTDIAPDYADLTPEIGITSTPVIDPASGTLYVVAKSKDEAGYHQQLHALDMASGNERPNSPVEITASVQGTGDGSVNGAIAFDPLLQLNRPALLLANGLLYIAFGSHGDLDPYHGWVLAYDAASLNQVAIYNTTPGGGRGSIWQAGQGLVADGDGSVYFVTANGTCDYAGDCGMDLGESFVKLDLALNPVDWFTPSNRGVMDQEDLDLGSGGPILIPGTTDIAAAGKDGFMRVVNCENMGRYNPDANLDLQEFQATTGPFAGAPIYWNSPASGPTIYMWGSGDYMKAFAFDGQRFNANPVSQGADQAPAGVPNSAPLSLSANGSQPGSGIVWASCPIAGDPGSPEQGELLAYEAANLQVELWNSEMNQARDQVGAFAKFCPPTVAGGKVYVATFSGQLAVYGLIPCSYSVQAPAGTFKWRGGQVEISVQTGQACPWSASTDSSWLVVTSGSTGTGPGSVIVAVEPDNSAGERVGHVTVAGTTTTVAQKGRASARSR